MDNLIQITKALADENRLSILKMLLRHDLCVGALSAHIGISEAAVSQHLKVLREAGLVTGEKRGYFTHYSVNRDLLREAAMEIESLAALTREKMKCKNGGHSCCRSNGDNK